MEKILILIVAACFLYALLYRPAIALVLFFTMTIAAVNFELPGTGINVRPIIAALLLIRSVFEGNRVSPSAFFSVPQYRLVLLFFAYVILVSWGRDTLYGENLRLLLLSVVTAYLGYYAYALRGNASLLKAGIVLSAFVCLADLVYTYAVIGNFPVQRIYYLVFPDANIMEELNDTNHNFYGFICGIAFVLLLSEHVHSRLEVSGWSLQKMVQTALMPVFLIGVLMSTSRSALLGLLMASAFIIYQGMKDPQSRRRTVKMMSLGAALVFFVLLLFVALQGFFELDNAFITNISFRLLEEPVAVLRKNLGMSYNVQDLDAMDWRSESASLALKAYGELDAGEQIFGVGVGGYLQRNLGHNGLNPHNGLLYILLNCGLAGFLIYFSLVAGLVWRSLKRKPASSLLLVMVFIIFFSLGQNEELISATALLFISTLIMENREWQEPAVAQDHIGTKQKSGYGWQHANAG